LTGCNNGYFTDPLPGADNKACFCDVSGGSDDEWDWDMEEDWDYDYDYESSSWYEFCATEGGDCMCGGDIYYGAYVDEDLDWEQDWVTMASDESGLTGCNNGYFTDPLPGADNKACFCDVSGGSDDEWDWDYEVDWDMYDFANDTTDGQGYRGTLATTSSGLTCQNWEAQEPQ
jgi:hypothetical protein